MRPFEEIDRSPSLDLNFYFPKKFKNVFELAYALTDLHSVLSTFYYVGSNRLEKAQLPTTVRTFTKSYGDALTLKDFRSGSFGAEVGTTVAAGLLLKFLERYFFETQQPQPATINININAPIQVNIQDPAQLARIDQVIQGVQIVPGNVEASVNNFVASLTQSQIVGPNVLFYDPNGIRVLAASIERLGRSIDINA